MEQPQLKRRLMGRAICIHPRCPECCPKKDCGKSLYGVARAQGAPSNTRAYQCESGHRLHVWDPPREG